MEGIVVVAAILVAVIVAGVLGTRRRAQGPGRPGSESPMPQRSQENQMRAAEEPTHHGEVGSGPALRHEPSADGSETPGDQRP
jgi:hypothetical protein